MHYRNLKNTIVTTVTAHNELIWHLLKSMRNVNMATTVSVTQNNLCKPICQSSCAKSISCFIMIQNQSATQNTKKVSFILTISIRWTTVCISINCLSSFLSGQILSWRSNSLDKNSSIVSNLDKNICYRHSNTKTHLHMWKLVSAKIQNLK